MDDKVRNRKYNSYARVLILDNFLFIFPHYNLFLR